MNEADLSEVEQADFEKLLIDHSVTATEYVQYSRADGRWQIIDRVAVVNAICSSLVIGRRYAQMQQLSE